MPSLTLLVGKSIKNKSGKKKVADSEVTADGDRTYQEVDIFDWFIRRQH